VRSALHQLSGSTIDGASYTLDNAGNRTAKTDQQAGVTSNYAYDAISGNDCKASNHVSRVLVRYSQCDELAASSDG
jgi:hypothetical protein